MSAGKGAGVLLGVEALAHVTAGHREGRGLTVIHRFRFRSSVLKARGSWVGALPHVTTVRHGGVRSQTHNACGGLVTRLPSGGTAASGVTHAPLGGNIQPRNCMAQREG